jgi:hypothetical protein
MEESPMDPFGVTVIATVIIAGGVIGWAIHGGSVPLSRCLKVAWTVFGYMSGLVLIPILGTLIFGREGDMTKNLAAWGWSDPELEKDNQ